MQVKEIIESGIQGGWRYPHLIGDDAINSSALVHHINTILLDPNFLKAVGKTEGWDKIDKESMELYRMSGGGGKMITGMYQHVKKMHNLINTLCEASNKPNFNVQETIISYIKTL